MIRPRVKFVAERWDKDEAEIDFGSRFPIDDLDLNIEKAHVLIQIVKQELYDSGWDIEKVIDLAEDIVEDHIGQKPKKTSYKETKGWYEIKVEL